MPETNSAGALRTLLIHCLPVIVIVAAEILLSGVASLFNAATYMLLLGYQWVVTRTALVALDFVVGVILCVLAPGMLH